MTDTAPNTPSGLPGAANPGAADPGGAAPGTPGAGGAPDTPGADTPTNGQPPEGMSVGQLAFEVFDRGSTLIREEVELAKTELSEKLGVIFRGSAVGAAAGVFVLMALAMLMHAIAWLFNDLFFGDTIWAGFLLEAGLLLVVAAAAGYWAYRAIRKVSPPVPAMAISEAKEIRRTFEGSS